VRPLDADERKGLPLLARGSALRFLLTRLYDWVHTPPDAWSSARIRRNTSPRCASIAALRRSRITGCERSRVEIFTDGACSGNPGPGGWGAILRLKKSGRGRS
jgi:hypothetical protein